MQGLDGVERWLRARTCCRPARRGSVRRERSWADARLSISSDATKAIGHSRKVLAGASLSRTLGGRAMAIIAVRGGDAAAACQRRGKFQKQPSDRGALGVTVRKIPVCGRMGVVMGTTSKQDMRCIAVT